ncbi:BSP-domain-containing protein [Parathielavia appendiculata]|uniref:BSP-domain-containing protein n=1 Tax=Parathielavia appendiculata TaxID=2587402 RepID=A0AAN6U512_9PEZI|nr:BSP-domain-containing protein [Parathielavia appendiculata]
MTVREQNYPASPTQTPVPLPDRTRDITIEPSQQQASQPKTGDRRFAQPKLRLKIHDLGHPGAAKFLNAVNAATVVSAAVENVLRLLYRSPSDGDTTVPPTRSVTIVLRDMGGVAYTTGTDLDDDHKAIHFSLNYINSISPASRLKDEITGVITHELVHCYQWDAQGTCPGGLIEGIADWVRLNCNLSPPHWKRETGGDWDRGYQHTAYFLQYLELRFGEGTIRRLNDKLRNDKYKAECFWPELFGQSVDKLFGDYVKKAKDEDGDLCSQ